MKKERYLRFNLEERERMSSNFFKHLEERAAKKYDKINNPVEKINNRKFINRRKEEYVDYSSIFNKNNERNNKKNNKKEKDEHPEDFYGEELYDDDAFNLYPSQKSESFHFFILENQYKDLERLIRGVKDVWDKEQQKWMIKRKSEHCFTDEESEEIVRTAQSHLSSDIKLAIFSREEYPILMNLIYQQLWILFKEIMDYRFGRFGNVTKQLNMKQQAANIFNVLMMRIKANYSRAIEGRENRSTHDSVKGQESLQQTERKEFSRGYT